MFTEEDDNEMKTFFKYKLQRLIKNNEISQSELASQVGVSQQTISKYISGECMPSFVALKRLAKALHCSTEDFYYDDI